MKFWAGCERCISEIAIDLNHQERKRNDDEEQRLECKNEVAARAAENASVRANYHAQLILKEAYGKQVGFELIFRMFDGFLIGGVAENNHHQKTDYD